MRENHTDDALLRFAYGQMIEHFSDKQVREAAAVRVRDFVAARHPVPASQAPAESRQAVADMAETGVHFFEPFLTRQQCIEVLRHISQLPVYDNQSYSGSSRTPLLFEQVRNTVPVASYRVDHILQVPHLLEAALSPAIRDLAAAYLGCMPTMYGCNMYWSFPGHDLVRGVQHFHRDFDDLRFVTLFILLNDVSDAAGSHEFVQGSHRRDINLERFANWHGEHARSGEEAELKQQYRDPRILFAPNPYIDPLIHAIFGDRILRIAGSAGTTFAEDNFGLHRGVPPKGPRLLFWARYGYGPNAYSARVTPERVPASWLRSRIGDDETLRYLTRMLIDWDA
ncbi:hypothetical protein ACFOGJ_16465 [Marinibaculum pumilum]|uniref:Phytanoyl-CoA dioxygenase n=1 Tax=Marinibaculum pumilum TaxID=1766165 RepID=A0ABV7L399_9PROT